MGMRFVVALKAEAMFLIEHYRLRAIKNDLFPVYANEDNALVISGVGKCAAAAATSYLYSITQNSVEMIWVNFGIAGHRDRKIGSIAIADKITDRNSGKSWYPANVFRHQFASDRLITVEQPETEYPEVALYDMEGSGFCELAQKISTMELIQSCKIVTDNSVADQGKLNKQYVKNIISDNMGDLVDYFDRYNAWAYDQMSVYRMPEIYGEIIDRWHFSVTRRHQLKDALHALRALKSDYSYDLSLFNGCNSAAEVLQVINNILHD